MVLLHEGGVQPVEKWDFDPREKYIFRRLHPEFMTSSTPKEETTRSLASKQLKTQLTFPLFPWPTVLF